KVISGTGEKLRKKKCRMAVRSESPRHRGTDLGAKLVQKLKSNGGCPHTRISCRDAGIFTAAVPDGNDRLARKRRRCRDSSYGDYCSIRNIDLKKCGRGRDREIRRQRRETAIVRKEVIRTALRRLE